MANKKVLAVYYSNSGKTKKVIEALARKMGCDVEELIDSKKRSGLFGFIRAGRDAMSKKLTEIGSTMYDPANYELVVLATPTWAGTISSAIRTYIVRNKSRLNNLAFIVTQAGPDPKVLANFEEACGKAPVATCLINGKELKSGDWTRKLDKFVKAIGGEEDGAKK